MSTRNPAIHDHFIFGDESSRTAHEFCVVGTIDCPREHVEKIKTRLNVALKGHSEYAWRRDPSRELDYFVDEIFHFIGRGQWWFRCMVVKMRHANHQKFSHGDRDLSLEKFIFQHLLGFARRQADFEKLTRFYVELDNRTDKYKGPAQKATLHHRFGNETGHQWEIFADVTDVDSKAQIMVQAADVLAGCVAWVTPQIGAGEKGDADHGLNEGGVVVSARNVIQCEDPARVQSVGVGEKLGGALAVPIVGVNHRVIEIVRVEQGYRGLTSRQSLQRCPALAGRLRSVLPRAATRTKPRSPTCPDGPYAASAPTQSALSKPSNLRRGQP